MTNLANVRGRLTQRASDVGVRVFGSHQCWRATSNQDIVRFFLTPHVEVVPSKGMALGRPNQDCEVLTCTGCMSAVTKAPNPGASQGKAANVYEVTIVKRPFPIPSARDNEQGSHLRSYNEADQILTSRCRFCCGENPSICWLLAMSNRPARASRSMVMLITGAGVAKSQK
ncbi:hypothetical protein KEM54_002037 [Ascosphaera aggregata]|nr:hypothetical protein KEM54_002037 [Ascosphaera aggregata]